MLTTEVLAFFIGCFRDPHEFYDEGRKLSIAKHRSSLAAWFNYTISLSRAEKNPGQSGTRQDGCIWSVAAHLPEAPGRWQECFAKAFTFDPQARPSSAQKLFSELERALV